MSYSNLVSPKVVASAAGAGAGATLTGFLVWLLGASLYGVGFDASVADAAVAAVPNQVIALIGLVLVVAGAFIPGYQVTDPARATEGAVEPQLTDEPAEEPVFEVDGEEPTETDEVEEPEVEATVEGTDSAREVNGI